MALCERCGKHDSSLGFEIRKYSFDDHIDRVLCRECYLKVALEIQQKRFPQVKTTRYCLNCGRSISVDFRLCPYCGHKFKEFEGK